MSERKHTITVELSDEELGNIKRVLGNTSDIRSCTSEPFFRAIRDYEPPVEPLRVGDELSGSRQEIVFVNHEAALLRDYPRYPNNDSCHMPYYHVRERHRLGNRPGLRVSRNYKEVLAPWPEADK